MNLYKTTILTTLLLTLLLTPTLTLTIQTSSTATKYREHGATLTNLETLSNETELEIWITDYNNMPIQQIHKYIDKETNEPHNYQPKYNELSIVWNIDHRYQVGKNYTLHVQGNGEKETSEFQVTGVKQPDIIGDFIITLAENTWVLAVVITVILLIFFLGLIWKYSVGYL